MTDTIQDVANRVLAARDGGDDARDTIIEDAIALAVYVLETTGDDPDTDPFCPHGIPYEYCGNCHEEGEARVPGCDRPVEWIDTWRGAPHPRPGYYHTDDGTACAYAPAGPHPPDGTSYAGGRKRHVTVPQDDYLRLFENGANWTTVALAATALNVSEATARRNLDGLVAQGKLRAVEGSAPGRIADRRRYMFIPPSLAAERAALIADGLCINCERPRTLNVNGICATCAAE